MFGLTTAAVDPFDALVEAAQGIVARREKVLLDILAAESRVVDADEQVRAAGAIVASEEWAAAQDPGGLAVASRGALAAVAGAELAAKSCRLRLDGLRARLNAIEESLEGTWAAIEKYRDEFLAGKIEAMSREFDEALKTLVHMICKARALSGVGFKWPKTHAPLNPVLNLAKCDVGNPFTGVRWVQPFEFVRVGDRMIASRSHWRIDPEAAAFRDVIDAVNQRVHEVGVLLGKVALSVAEEEAQGDGDAEGGGEVG